MIPVVQLTAAWLQALMAWRRVQEAEQRWNESHPVATSALLQLGSPAFKPESMLKVYRPRDVLPLDRRHVYENSVVDHD